MKFCFAIVMLLVSTSSFATGFSALFPDPTKNNLMTVSAGAVVSSVGTLGNVEVGVTHYPWLISAFSASGRLIYGSDTVAGLFHLTFQPIAAYPNREGLPLGIVIGADGGYGKIKSSASALAGISAALRICSQGPLCADVGGELLMKMDQGGYHAAVFNLVWMD